MRNLRATHYARRCVPASRHKYKYIYPASLHSTTSRASSHSLSKNPQSSKNADNPEISLINAPATFPAPLSLPERDPDTSLPKHLLALGKSYLAFYKAGGKKIWHNRKTMGKITERIMPKYGAAYGKIVSKIDASDITRAEFQLYHRTWSDLKKLPIFALVFLICGEFTPLVVVFMTGVVPFTCKLPTQLDDDRQKLEKRRAISFRNLTEIPEKGHADVALLNRMQLLHISWSLGLCSSAWDWLGGQLPGLWTGALRKRLRQRLMYLNLDDRLIWRYGGVKKMDLEEVKVACVERGLDTVGRNEGQLRELLDFWIGMTTKAKAQPESLLLTR